MAENIVLYEKPRLNIHIFRFAGEACPICFQPWRKPRKKRWPKSCLSRVFFCPQFIEPGAVNAEQNAHQELDLRQEDLLLSW